MMSLVDDAVPGTLTGRMLDETTRLTHHALERWNERAPVGSINVGDAWSLAVDVPQDIVERVTTRYGDTPDRVRVYHGKAAEGRHYYMVFICCDTPKPHNRYGQAVLDGAQMDEWTNVVTCYKISSVPSEELQEDLREVTEAQEVVA